MNRKKVKKGDVVSITSSPHKYCKPGIISDLSREGFNGRLVYVTKCGCDNIVMVRSTNLELI